MKRWTPAPIGLAMVAILALPRTEIAPDRTIPSPAAPRSTGTISDVRYRVTFDRTTAPLRTIAVQMSFRTEGSDPVLLSLPAWTPGSYELDDYARNVSGFTARRVTGEDLRWDKVDYDTWRVFPGDGGEVVVGFDYRADQLDTGSAWSAPEFAFFNGTNLFLHPEGSLDYPSRVRILTEPDWGAVNGLTPDSAPGEFVAADYHELVDMPTFVGRFDVDSARIDGVLHRLATYPAGFLEGEARERTWAQLRGMLPAMAAVFDETPFDSYTTLMVFPEEFGGGSALEHRNSHLGIYARQFVGTPILPSIVAHEIFHAWNVKRLRPADLVPYAYGRPQPTTLLWVSEGITSYYDDLSLVRGGVYGPEYFYGVTGGDIGTIEAAGPVALEDASLSAWIGPRDGTGGIYYPKGAAAGFLLDILIRDATDDRASLDDVMRELYRRTYRESFTGFTESAFWDTVARLAEGRSFEDFYVRYVDGREPYPWDEVLPLAGLALRRDTTHRPLVGVYLQYDSIGARVTGLVPDGAAAAGGVREGDYILRAGPVEIRDASSFDGFREHFADRPAGTPYEVAVRRGGEALTLELELRISEEVQATLVEDPGASPGAVRIRESLLRGG